MSIQINKNMETFDEILTSILKSVESNPSLDIDEVIAQKMSELGLSEEGQKKLAETNSHLEAYDKKFSELQAAKADGDSRSSWVQDELLSIARKHGLSEEQTEQLITDVSTACENEQKETLAGGE